MGAGSKGTPQAAISASRFSAGPLPDGAGQVSGSTLDNAFDSTAPCRSTPLPRPHFPSCDSSTPVSRVLSAFPEPIPAVALDLVPRHPLNPMPAKHIFAPSGRGSPVRTVFGPVHRLARVKGPPAPQDARKPARTADARPPPRCDVPDARPACRRAVLAPL